MYYKHRLPVPQPRTSKLIFIYKKKRFIIYSLPRCCNFRCIFCGVKKYKKKKKINFSVIKRILDIATKNGIKELRMGGGGEMSLFFDDILKIIQFAHQRGMLTTVVTNCSFILNKKIKNPIKKLKESGLSALGISVDYDHLKFIPYTAIVSVIKKALNFNIKTVIKVVNRKETISKNKILLKKISNKLKGKLITVMPFTGLYGISLMLIGKKIVQVCMSYVIQNKENHKFINAKQIKHKNLAFMNCKFNAQNILIFDNDYNILPCCSFTCMSMPTLYSIGKISNPSKDIREGPNPFIKNILLKKFTFLKIYLKIQKNKKLKEIFLNEKFFSECDFCSWVLKYKNEIEKIANPTWLEIFLFTFSNFNIFLIEYFSYLRFMLEDFIVINILPSFKKVFVKLSQWLNLRYLT